MCYSLSLLRKVAVVLGAGLALAHGGRVGWAADESLRVAVFRVDATPRVGSPVAYALARKIDDPLSARGIVLLGAGKPIVLCAVDWIGIGNGGHDLWREKLAEAAGTAVDRVAVHVLHQHDGVRCDLTAEELLAEHGLGGKRCDPAFIRQVIWNTAAAIRDAIGKAQPVTHVGIGVAAVEKVASNRRILGPDGKVKLFRMSSWRISEPIAKRLEESAAQEGYTISPRHAEEAMAAPEGVIDPLLRMVSLWNGDRPLVCLTYYATHPQSYFGEGDVTAEFVGLARAQREQALNGLPHVHFNGAGGNIAAGKYNDGTPKSRVLLTERMADGMRRAWEATQKTPLTTQDIAWRVCPVALPANERLDLAELRKTLADTSASPSARYAAATKIAFLDRLQKGHKIDLSCLRLQNAYLLHLPGELFVEYQLAAQKLKPDATVCMAAYGDYGTGYIGTASAYSQGGYETSPRSSNVGPEVEEVLMRGIRELLTADEPSQRKR
ncbi:MAG: hypothetical protein ACK4RK_02845 [Gemmataceae bacterium]